MQCFLSVVGCGHGNNFQFLLRNNGPKKVSSLPEETFGKVQFQFFSIVSPQDELCITNLLKHSNIQMKPDLTMVVENYRHHLSKKQLMLKQAHIAHT